MTEILAHEELMTGHTVGLTVHVHMPGSSAHDLLTAQVHMPESSIHDWPTATHVHTPESSAHKLHLHMIMVTNTPQPKAVR